MMDAETNRRRKAIGVRHIFRPGQRVRLSPAGREQRLRPVAKFNVRGTVTKVDEFGCPTVRWDDRRTASGYHGRFIAPVPKRRS